jgi:hypothetical protein
VQLELAQELGASGEGDLQGDGHRVPAQAVSAAVTPAAGRLRALRPGRAEATEPRSRGGAVVERRVDGGGGAGTLKAYHPASNQSRSGPLARWVIGQGSV